MPRYKLTIEYDGTGYAGWQRQAGQPSIQGALEDAIFKFCSMETEVIGAGRTDAGVHALAQVAHVDLPKEFDSFRVMQGINYYLFSPSLPPPQAGEVIITTPPACGGGRKGEYAENRIAILRAEQISDDFHARFSATKRNYLYRIINRRARLALEANRAWHVIEELDVNAMNAAAQYLLGHHDFTSFRDTECQAKSPIKTLEQLQVMRHGEEVQIITSARSFLHHQVRIMVGTLAMAGKGKWQPEQVSDALDARNRSAAGPTAPADGLYLVKVAY